MTEEPVIPTVDEMRAAQNVLRRTVLAADLYRHAHQQVQNARRVRDQALYSYAKIDRVRPSEIERTTGVTGSMTNYATTRAAVNRDQRIEQPVETITSARAEIDRWETVLEEARLTRDAGIVQLAKEGKQSPQDLASLLRLTASRISQIGGGPLSHGRSSAPRVSLRLAELTDIAEEVTRRAEFVGARDQAAGVVLQAAAAGIADVARQGL